MGCQEKRVVSDNAQDESVCDTPLSQGRSAETLEDILSPNTPQVYATEIFNIVSAVESALKLIPRIRDLRDEELVTNMTCISRIFRDCLWLGKVQGAETRDHELNP